MSTDTREPEGRGAEDALVASRRAKLDRLRAGGIDPFPGSFDRRHVAAELHERHGRLGPGEATGERARVAGRVMLHRSFGNLVFATLQDSSGRIQLLCSRSDLDPDAFERCVALDIGDWVGAAGEVITTKKGELSVRVEELTLLAKGLRPLPDKWHGLADVELRSRRRYLDLLVNPEARRVAETRIRVVSELRRQFESRGFLEVETPVLLTQAGGALARPFETHHSALDLVVYLRIATELPLKMLVVGGFDRVFEIGRIFRNEGIDAVHMPEFTMLEAYQALADYQDIMRLVEEVIEAAAVAAAGSPTIEHRGRQLDLSAPYRRARLVDLVADAVGEQVWPGVPAERLAVLADRHGVETEPGWPAGKIVEELFERLVQPGMWEPTFVIDHPADVSPLARRHHQDPSLAERFELVIAGGEYCNAYSELNDPVEQRLRFEAQARARAGGDEEAHVVDEGFLRALEYGMPPTGGLGIGVDRLVMLLTDQTHIREVILFPLMRPEA